MHLAPGKVARITGLRGAVHLNGTPVLLQYFDEESQRWAVEMCDGSIKSVRAKNLDPMDGEAALWASMHKKYAQEEARSAQKGRADAQPSPAAAPPTRTS